MRKLRTYYVGKIRLSFQGRRPVREYYEAVRNIDFLNCEALHPIVRIEAFNKKEAIRRFREEQN